MAWKRDGNEMTQGNAVNDNNGNKHRMGANRAEGNPFMPWKRKGTQGPERSGYAKHVADSR